MRRKETEEIRFFPLTEYHLILSLPHYIKGANSLSALPAKRLSGE